MSAADAPADPRDPEPAPLPPAPDVDVIGLDADDTLWHNETFYADAGNTFAEIIAPWTPDGEDIAARHYATERRNLELFGYGAKGFTLSMIETAIEVSAGQVSTAAIEELLALGKRMLAHPVDLLDGVRDAVERLAAGHRVVVITKGDLFHQEQKFAASGLHDLVERVEVVSEKDVATYRTVIGRTGVEPSRFLMVGNSVRSDVLPPIEAGGHAAHVPYEITWVHEHVDDVDVAFPVLPSLSAFADWVTSR